MDKPRSAAAVGDEFPYASKVVCYVEVSESGSVTWGRPDGAVFERVRAGASQLLAVWPGQWSSHLFVIDDLDAAARGLGILRDGVGMGLAEHIHDVEWAISRHEANPSAPYVSIDVAMHCGCEIKDLRAFADAMRRQRGWDVATSAGWGSSHAPGKPATYSVRVRRRSLVAR